MEKYNQETEELLEKLRAIVGNRYVLTKPDKTARYRNGFRSGKGDAVAVIVPGTLLEQWHVFKLLVEANRIVIMQAANTGLTEGSTPSGNDYDREVFIINTLRLDKIYFLESVNQVIALPGSTLWELEKLLKPLGREPHSVIGSSCIGASVIGGICNNSGGILVQRGPAYTELALYGRVDENGKVVLVNHLGIDLGDTPEEILTALEYRRFSNDDIKATDRSASDRDYQSKVRDVDADTPSRFNADEQRLFEASGSAGKLSVFAVRLDTFVSEDQVKVFYIGTNDTDLLEDLRRHILTTFKELPIAGEYMHRDYYQMAKVYGKDTFVIIKTLGTRFMPKMFRLKSQFDAITNKIPFLPKNLSDHLLQFFSYLWPKHLPKRMEEYHKKYEHHLMLKMGGEGVDEARAFLKTFFKDRDPIKEGAYFECTDREGEDAFLHRFAAAGSAIRYYAVNSKKVEGILPLDIALRRNDREWLETLPPELDAKLEYKLYISHFFCHVMHQDYIVKKGFDPHQVKEEMLAILDARGARYPAEHNVGHLYKAPKEQADFFRATDPLNVLNPGVGLTSRYKYWADTPCHCCSSTTKESDSEQTSQSS